jgi:hypothetical protein
VGGSREGWEVGDAPLVAPWRTRAGSVIALSYVEARACLCMHTATDVRQHLHVRMAARCVTAVVAPVRRAPLLRRAGVHDARAAGGLRSLQGDGRANGCEGISKRRRHDGLRSRPCRLTAVDFSLWRSSCYSAAVALVTLATRMCALRHLRSLVRLAAASWLQGLPDQRPAPRPLEPPRRHMWSAQHPAP